MCECAQLYFVRMTEKLRKKLRKNVRIIIEEWIEAVKELERELQEFAYVNVGWLMKNELE